MMTLSGPVYVRVWRGWWSFEAARAGYQYDVRSQDGRTAIDVYGEKVELCQVRWMDGGRWREVAIETRACVRAWRAANKINALMCLSQTDRHNQSQLSQTPSTFNHSTTTTLMERTL